LSPINHDLPVICGITPQHQPPPLSQIPLPPANRPPKASHNPTQAETTNPGSRLANSSPHPTSLSHRTYSSYTAGISASAMDRSPLSLRHRGACRKPPKNYKTARPWQGRRHPSCSLLESIHRSITHWLPQLMCAPQARLFVCFVDLHIYVQVPSSSYPFFT